MSQLQEYVDSQVATRSPFKIKSQELLEQAKAKEVIIDQFQLLSDAKGGSNTAPATERYAEEDTKSANTTTKQAAKATEDVDLDAPIDLSEIPF